MSSALAIAAVTAVLRKRLQNGLIDAVQATNADVKVTALPPNRLAVDGGEVSGVNLFMYHVTPNQGWRNVGLPALNGNGQRAGNVPLALDLHYLLSAYGAEDLHTDVLLGYAMQLLHETPVITRDAIEQAITPNGLDIDAEPSDLPQPLQNIVASDLVSQVELVKLTPETFTTEEMSRLWSAFQAPYRPTALYRASVVLIEREHEVRPPLPVLQRSLSAQTIRQPVVTAIVPAGEGAALILPGSTVRVRGRGLRSEPTRVLLDGTLVAGSDDAGVEITASSITFPLPATVPAGVHALQVVHPWLLGSPPVPHAGVQSDAVSFVLHPRIARDAAGQDQILVEAVTTPEGEPRTRFTVTLVPGVAPGQRVLLELLRRAEPPDPTWPGTVQLVHLGEASVLLGDAHRVSCDLANVPAGAYLLRVRVDGAESPLDFDPTDGSAVAPLAMVA